MKKLLFGLLVCSSLGLGIIAGNNNSINVRAEGEPEIVETSSEIVETSSEIASSETTPIPTTPDEIENWGEELLKKWLSPEAIAVLTTWGGTIIALIVSLVRSAKYKTLQIKTADEVEKAVMGKLKETIDTAISELTPQILGAIEKQTDVLETFSKVLCLAQENTPESRVAIINLLTEIGMVKKENADETVKVIEQQKQDKVEKEQEVDQKLDEIIDDGTTI